MFRARIKLTDNINTVYEQLQTHCYKICVLHYRPSQIVINFDICTFILFRTGNCRIMGKSSSYEEVFCILNYIVSLLDSMILSSLTCVSQTAIIQLHTYSLNLHKLCRVIPNNIFEPELFPSLSIDYFKPLHVNLFSTGKIVVLGKDALSKCKDIVSYFIPYL